MLIIGMRRTRLYSSVTGERNGTRISPFHGKAEVEAPAYFPVIPIIGHGNASNSGLC